MLPIAVKNKIYSPNKLNEIIRCGLYMRCGLSIERFLFVNLDNCEGRGLYTGCGLYSQKYGNLIANNRSLTELINY